jgi:citrate synthase
MSAMPEIHRGLIGVHFDRSSICSIDGEVGDLRYRGYSIHELADRSSFEETAFLLLAGELPTPDELAAFDAALKEARVLPEPILALLQSLREGHPMDVLRTGVSALAVFDPEVRDTSTAATHRKAIRLMSQIPLLVATHHRLRQGLELVPSDPALGHAANFLYQLTGERPSPRIASLIDTDMILHAEHGTNASSFAARVVVGTQADLHAALTAAVAALSGPAHGGAAENVMKMVRDVGSPERAADYVRAKRAAKEPVMGFGHRVYRTEDPRARHLREGVRQLSSELDQPQWFETLEAVVAAMAPYARHGVHVNVDFYAGVIYHLLGLPEDLFVPIFAIGRAPGWAAQALEQLENNILLRPLTTYAGPEARSYRPVEERSVTR